jgi:hypothetical protein
MEAVGTDELEALWGLQGDDGIRCAGMENRAASVEHMAFS